MNKVASSKCKISSIAKVISGYAFRSMDFLEDDGIPVIKIRNIRLGNVDTSKTQYISEEFLALDSKYHVLPGDILVSLTGSHINQPDSVVGRVARCPSGMRRALLNQRAGKVIINDTEKCDPSYLYYFLFDERTRRNIAAFAHGAANQANVSPSQIESLEICLPNILAQGKISSILSAYDDLIDNNHSRIKILEEMARSIYREWFVHFRFPDCQKVRMVNSPLGKIPEGWRVRNLVELAEFERGVEPGSSAYEAEMKADHVPFLRVGDLGARASNLYIHRSLANARLLEPDDIAITMDGTVGTVKTGLVGAYSSGIRRVVPRPESPVGRTFLYYLLQSEHIQGIITAHAKGTTIKHASSSIESMILAVPPDPVAVLAVFEKTVAPMLQQVRTLLRVNRNLQSTRDLLLPKLISGDLDVSNLDIKLREKSA